ncbi:rRNA maturation RNase YbeY [Aestuariivivens sediminicola]|uniref:rRNA maturation RNase YbeY n=1 Tax=Aestuariivivens sediminicola TaxID=2913560 RepID=UPI001F5AB5AF|nr:rRNA maturation RNase YbeY [Aestuariivivens sediminicola]
MIDFIYETDFRLANEDRISRWITDSIKSEGFKEGDITYVFCNDDYLYQINVEYLNHHTYTDIISFDYKLGKTLHGEIYISVDRVKDNAKRYNVEFYNELCRVMIHGILHYCGYKDKSENEIELMREKEDYYLSVLEIL